MVGQVVSSRGYVRAKDHNPRKDLVVAERKDALGKLDRLSRIRHGTSQVTVSVDPRFMAGTELNGTELRRDRRGSGQWSRITRYRRLPTTDSDGPIQLAGINTCLPRLTGRKNSLRRVRR